MRELFSTSVMKRHLVFLVNPISGTGDKHRLTDLIRKKTTLAGLEFTISQTNRNGDYSGLKELINEGKVSDVIICGGDGTVNQVVSGLMNLPVNFGIIPMGSGNGLALAAGIPRNPSKALDIIFKGRAGFIDAFYINDQFSCMLCGLGFDAQVAHDFAQQESRGLATYVRQTIKNFIVAPVYPFTLRVHDTEINTEAFFISIANSNQFGNNVKIAPKASLNDGLLDIVVVNKMSKMRMVYSLLMQIRLGQVVPVTEKKYHQKDIHYFQAKELTIYNPGNAPFHIDGDPCKSSGNYHIRVVENAFRLLQD